ncbi:MAG: kelch repeat-containing protein [Bacteroidales bacterium]
MKKSLLFICSFLAMNFANAQWSQKSSMFGFGRFSGVGFAINGKAYVGLGQIYDESYVYDFREYNPVSDTWTKKADYPGRGSYAASAFVINGKGYVCLGADNSVNCQYDMWEYSPESDTWLQKPGFPGIERYGASCFVIGDTAFLGTGSYGNGKSYLSDMWMYVGSTNSWTRIADFPGDSRSHATAFTIGKYGFMGTGIRDNVTATGDMWKYDRSSDTWERIPEFPGLAGWKLCNFVINEKAYVGTGSDLNNAFNRFFEYDPVKNSWSAVMNIPVDLQVRLGAVGFSIGNVGYLATGFSNYDLLTDLWAFDPNASYASPGIPGRNRSNLYPNPVKQILNLETTGKGIKLTISTTEGEELLSRNIVNTLTQVDLSGLAKGVYVAKLTSERTVEVKKIVKE